MANKVFIFYKMLAEVLKLQNCDWILSPFFKKVAAGYKRELTETTVFKKRRKSWANILLF